MVRPAKKEMRIVEACLVVSCIGLTVLLSLFQGYKMVVLNLFYLPIVLTGFFLGRYRAGILAFFCVIAATTVAVFSLDTLAVNTSPIVLLMAIIVWGAVLGMTAMLVGTLSDERSRKTGELHEAYVGVVEVLAQYLQSAHPKMKARAIRVAELSQQVAEGMKLSPKQVDDIRVASLLYDVEDLEITAKVIRDAVGTLESDNNETFSQNTFRGKDLVLSLGPVLSGAMPLINCGGANGDNLAESPIGSRIIDIVRSYDILREGDIGSKGKPSAESLAYLRQSTTSAQDREVLTALERVVARQSKKSADSPELQAV